MQATYSVLCLIVKCEDLLYSVHQEVWEQRTAEDQDTVGDTLRPVAQVPLTTRDALNITNWCCGVTNRFRDTAFYNQCLASKGPWWKERKQRL